MRFELTALPISLSVTLDFPTAAAITPSKIRLADESLSCLPDTAALYKSSFLRSFLRMYLPSADIGNPVCHLPEAFSLSSLLHLYSLPQFHNFYNLKGFLHKNQAPLSFSDTMQTTEMHRQFPGFPAVCGAGRYIHNSLPEALLPAPVFPCHPQKMSGNSKI